MFALVQSSAAVKQNVPPRGHFAGGCRSLLSKLFNRRPERQEKDLLAKSYVLLWFPVQRCVDEMLSIVSLPFSTCCNSARQKRKGCRHRCRCGSQLQRFVVNVVSLVCVCPSPVRKRFADPAANASRMSGSSSRPFQTGHSTNGAVIAQTSVVISLSHTPAHSGQQPTICQHATPRFPNTRHRHTSMAQRLHRSRHSCRVSVVENADPKFVFFARESMGRSREAATMQTKISLVIAR